MAKGDLTRLLQEISDSLANEMRKGDKGSQRFRKILERRPHDLTVSKQALIEEISLQVQDLKRAVNEPRTDSGRLGQSLRKEFGSGSGRTREQSQEALASFANFDGLTPAQIKFIEAEAEKIVKDIANMAPNSREFVPLRFDNKLRRGLEVRRLDGDGKNSVTIRIRGKTGSGSSPFDAIKDTVLASSKARIARNLLPTILSSEDIADASTRFFNLGHVTSVSDIKAAKTLQSLDRRISSASRNMDAVSKAATDTLKLQIMSRFTKLGDPELRKEFFGRVIVVTPESEAANQTDSTYEKAVLEDVKKALRTAIITLNKDWAGQSSSDSAVDATAKLLIAGAVRRGAKTRARIKVDREPSHSNSEIKLKRPKESPAVQEGMSYGELPSTGRQATKSQVSLAYLIPSLNDRLPAIVKSNMGKRGRLTNRTGRFAESAEIVYIDNSNIGFTYQTDPYAVFESQGSRDPRDLIGESIRLLASNIMMQKFNVVRV
jgi:hypothetical protein